MLCCLHWMKFTHCSLSIMEEITIECWRYFSNVKAQVPLFLLVVERLKEFSRYEFTSTFSLHTFGERKRGHLILYIHATCLEGPWGFRHSKRAERHVHLHTRGKVSHGYFIYWNKEEARALIYQIWSYYYSTAGSRWFSTTIEGTYECLQITCAVFSSLRTPCVC